MSASLHALLAGLIDYAGLFPPAKLPLDEAMRNYARHRQEPEAWMLGRFICPAARLAELAMFREELFSSGGPLALSVLGRGGGSTREYLQGIADDVEAILSFRHEWGEAASVEVLELRLPGELCSPGQENDLRAAVLGPPALLEKAGVVLTGAFYEVEPGSGWQDRFHLLAGVLRHDPQRRLGFKLRCGGLQASAFPSAEEVSFAVASCHYLQLPLKFTAGLHHPIRHFDAGLQTAVHGFLNVFVAGVLTHAGRLDAERVQEVIEDTEARHFAFDDAGLRWNDLHATADEITAARREAVTSFGSCSFDEPRDDLRALGLIK